MVGFMELRKKSDGTTAQRHHESPPQPGARLQHAYELLESKLLKLGYTRDSLQRSRAAMEHSPSDLWEAYETGCINALAELAKVDKDALHRLIEQRLYPDKEEALAKNTAPPAATTAEKANEYTDQSVKHPLDHFLAVLLGTPLHISAAPQPQEACALLKEKLLHTGINAGFIDEFLESIHLALHESLTNSHTSAKQKQQLDALQQLLQREDAGKQLLAALELLTDRKKEKFHILANAYVYLVSKEGNLSTLESVLLRFLLSKPIENFMGRFVSNSTPTSYITKTTELLLFPSRDSPQAFKHQARLYRHRVTIDGTSYTRRNLEVLCGHYFAKQAQVFAKITNGLLCTLGSFYSGNYVEGCKGLNRVRKHLMRLTPQKRQKIKSYLSAQCVALPPLLISEMPIDASTSIPIRELQAFTQSMQLFTHQELSPAIRLHDFHADYLRFLVTVNTLTDIEFATNPNDEETVYNAIKRAQYLAAQQQAIAEHAQQSHPGMGHIMMARASYNFVYFLDKVRQLNIDHEKMLRRYPELLSTTLARYLTVDSTMRATILTTQFDAIQNLIATAIRIREACVAVEFNGLFDSDATDPTIRGFEASSLKASPLKPSLADLSAHFTQMGEHFVQKPPHLKTTTLSCSSS